jgi:hypothetical protein
MDALGIALIVLGLTLVCGGFIFSRGFSEKPNEESFEKRQSGEIPQSLEFERHLLEDLNAMDPEVRNKRGEDHKPGG